MTDVDTSTKANKEKTLTFNHCEVKRSRNPKKQKMSPIGAFKNDVIKRQLPSSDNKTGLDFTSPYKNIGMDL